MQAIISTKDGFELVSMTGIYRRDIYVYLITPYGMHNYRTTDRNFVTNFNNIIYPMRSNKVFDFSNYYFEIV